jgi:hypothetical protein
MKGNLFLQMSVGLVLLTLVNGCAIIDGVSVLKANSEITKSELSSENESFEQESGINLTYVKRGLWSMQFDHRSRQIKAYFDGLMNNTVIFVFDPEQKEYARQKREGDTVFIIINRDFTDFSNLEKAVMLTAAVSSLAVLNDAGTNKTDAVNMFFKCINGYYPDDIPAIINSGWYKAKGVTVSLDSVTIQKGA